MLHGSMITQLTLLLCIGISSQSTTTSPLNLIGALSSYFDHLDVSPHDGFISESEAMRTFTDNDINGDGNITLHEYEVDLHNKLIADGIFNYFDKDGDGVLEKTLLHKYFLEVDVNPTDGKVSHSEYHAYTFKLALDMLGLSAFLG